MFRLLQSICNRNVERSRLRLNARNFMDHRILKVLCLAALFLLPASSIESQTVLEPLLRDPSRAEWSSLSRFSQTVTRGEFEQRLREVFDPFHGLDQFLQITNSSVRSSPLPGENN